MSDVIEHHGILGMKWGVRRTQAQLGHAPKGGSKDGAVTKPKVSTSAPPKRVRNSELTDEELRSRITRMEMEKKYKDLDKSLNPRKEFFKNLLMDSTRDLCKQWASKVIEKAIKSKFDEPKPEPDKNEYTLSDVSKLDVSTLDPTKLKFASDVVKNALVVNKWQNDAQKPTTKGNDSKPDTKADSKPETKSETESSTQIESKLSPSTPVSVSFVNKYLYGKSGATAAKEKRKREREAENDMRRLGL